VGCGGAKGRRVIRRALNSGDIEGRERGRKRGREREREGGRAGLIREEGREGIDNGEPGVTAILYLARHDRVNELSLRGGPTPRDTLFPLASSPGPRTNCDQAERKLSRSTSERFAASVVRPRVFHVPANRVPWTLLARSRLSARAPCDFLAISANSCEFRQSRRDELAKNAKKPWRHDLRYYFCGRGATATGAYSFFFFSLSLSLSAKDGRSFFYRIEKYGWRAVVMLYFAGRETHFAPTSRKNYRVSWKVGRVLFMQSRR